MKGKKTVLQWLLMGAVAWGLTLPGCIDKKVSMQMYLEEQARLRTLDRSLAATVTVAVKKQRELGKVILGFRGNASEEAYAQSLRLTNTLGSGSGFIIQRNGTYYVVTNTHVIESADDAQGSLYVYSYNRNRYEVKVLGGDTWFDIAVLEFVDPPGDELRSMEFAQRPTKVGQKVYAIGNSLGQFPNTITDGIISALNRTNEGLTGKFGYVQSTATTIWGNSGGPLVDAQGRVVGLVTRGHFASGPDGNTYLQQQLNFALAAEMAQKISNEIIDKGMKQRAFLGLELSYSHELFSFLGRGILGDPITPHPQITYVLPGPNSEIWSEYLGQYITHINDREVKDLEDVLSIMERTLPQDQISVRIQSRFSAVPARTIQITTQAAQPEDNANIAQHVLEDLLELSVYPNSPQLKVYSEELRGSAYLIAGGMQSNLWRLTTAEDLGGVLRILGLNGSVQLYFAQEAESSDEDIQQLHIPFENNYLSQRNFTQKLWY